MVTVVKAEIFVSTAGASVAGAFVTGAAAVTGAALTGAALGWRFEGELGSEDGNNDP